MLSSGIAAVASIIWVAPALTAATETLEGEESGVGGEDLHLKETLLIKGLRRLAFRSVQRTQYISVLGSSTTSNGAHYLVP